MSTSTGSGTPGGGDVERLLDGGGQVAHVGDQVVVLGHRPGDADVVRLLEGVAADDRGRDLSREADNGDRVGVGGGQARHRVGERRAGGHQGHTRTTAGAGVAVRHVDRALLVAGQDVA